MATSRALACAALLALVAHVAATTNTISFTGIPVPTGDAVNTRSTFTELTINGKKLTVKYEPILEANKTYPGFDGNPWVVGTVLDIYGTPLTAADHPAADPALANDFDRTSIFQKWGKIWMFTQNEDTFGNLFLCELSQDNTTGVLSIAKAKSLDLGSVQGASRPCSGAFTRWGSHLMAGEDLADARAWPPASIPTGIQHQAVVHRLPNPADVNPYWYGWVTEASVINANGDVEVGNRYGLGRFWHEIADVLPDERTVISTDDESSGGILTLFVAQAKRDLRRGRLYAAKVQQISSVDGGEFTVEWVDLNPEKRVINEKMIQWAIAPRTYGESRVKFEDIFDVATVQYINGTSNPRQMDLSKLPFGYKVVRTQFGNRLEWLRLKPGMGVYAAAMESVRMAAYVGATVEWTKIEGLAWDPVNKVMYMASTSIRRSMTDNAVNFDYGGPNQIGLPNIEGGAVYRISFGKQVGVSSDWVPKNVKAILTSYGYNASKSENSIPFDAIASPDNLGIMSKYQILLIAEDCDVQHLNNHFWAYDLRKKTLTRIMTTSIDAEVTSGYYFKNIGRFSYLTATEQHPRQSIGNQATVGHWVLPFET